MRSSSAASQRHAIRHVSIQRIVRRSLIGENVRDHAAIGEFRNDVGAIADQSDGDIFFFADGILQNAQRLIERGDHEIAVAGLQALLDALGIDVNSQKSRAGHGCGQRLSSAHSAHAAADDQLAGEIAAEMFFACGGKSFEGALHDALRADIDPRAGGHLAIHHQAGALQFVELLPVRPMADQVRVGDQHARRVFVRFETPTGLPDCTSRVSSFSSFLGMRRLRDRPPNCARRCRFRHRRPDRAGARATSSSRLFINMRMAASCCQPLQEILVPRGARIGV